MSEIFDRLRAALADRYVLERELGSGGMATVYLAHDLRHKRLVALKVLHPHLAATLGPERFQREIETAARLQHPHILTVHDSGETAGQLWFTMPFVEGESLRQRLRREIQLPVEDALRITTDVARALQHAHEHGVIHRDIKPENLLLTKDGSTLVADFGIARAVSGGGEQLTQTGMSVGTPTYMSPEQAAGDGKLDARTDVYSLGTVLYEMLVGEPPFTGPTAQAVIAKRFTGEVPRVRHVRFSVTESVDHAVARALAPVAADRFSSAVEFAHALQGSGLTQAPAPTDPALAGARLSPKKLAAWVRRRVQVAATALTLGLLLGLGLLFIWRGSPSEVGTTSGTRLLAVLPFQNLGDSADAYFADGVTDAVRGKLANIDGLRVIASTSAGEYRDTKKPLPVVARELGVHYLLVGKIRWQRGSGAGSVEVSPELIDVSASGKPTTRWQQPFQAGITDLFTVQAEIAGQVAEALDVALGARDREQLAARPTANPAAYDEYLRGHEALAGEIATAEALQRAIRHFERAVAQDSALTLAWAELALSHATIYYNSTPDSAHLFGARRAAERAVALEPGSPLTRRAMGQYYSLVLKEWDRALEEFALGLQVAPQDAALLAAAAFAQVSLGRYHEAVASLRQGQALDPRSATTARQLTVALLWLRRYPEGLEAADRTLTLAPNAPGAVINKVMILLARGDLAGAQAVVRAVAAHSDEPGLVATLATYWDLYWVLDDPQQRLLLRLQPGVFGDERLTWALSLAQTHALRGDTARGRAYADSARMAAEAQIREAPENPDLHSLHGLALAYMGVKAQAVREGQRGLELATAGRDAYTAAYLQHQLVRIYLLLHEPDKALDHLEPLLQMPYYLSPGWLSIDPTFDAVRRHPRFQRLVEERHRPAGVAPEPIAGALAAAGHDVRVLGSWRSSH